MKYIKIGQEASSKSGLKGIVHDIDWDKGKIVAVGLQVKDGMYSEIYHVPIENLQVWHKK